MQNRAMREYTARRGWTIALQIREVNSGAVRREARETILEAARRREIDLVPVWRLDSWGRSVTDLPATLQELEHLGVGFVSLTEALDLTTTAGRAMAGLLAIFVELEREILRERTRAGLGACADERGNGGADRRYGGGAGEQIDLLSGNLNYTVPLLKAMSRRGWGAASVYITTRRTGGRTRAAVESPGTSAWKKSWQTESLNTISSPGDEVRIPAQPCSHSPWACGLSRRNG
jgi:putative DNA-invertase from lambdoid prophage Rac